MLPRRSILCLTRLILLSALLPIPTVAFAQMEHPAIAATSTPLDAQKSFAELKTLAGSWQGKITTDNPAWATGEPMHLVIRSASNGNALIHELDTGLPEVTMFYVAGDQLTLLHYCDFGTRPVMIARPTPDGRTTEVELSSFTGTDQIGHVTHAVFTSIDPNHHTEDWVFLPADHKPVHAHIDFSREQ